MQCHAMSLGHEEPENFWCSFYSWPPVFLHPLIDCFPCLTYVYLATTARYLVYDPCKSFNRLSKGVLILAKVDLRVFSFVDNSVVGRSSVRFHFILSHLEGIGSGPHLFGLKSIPLPTLM